MVARTRGRASKGPAVKEIENSENESDAIRLRDSSDNETEELEIGFSKPNTEESIVYGSRRTRSRATRSSTKKEISYVIPSSSEEDDDDDDEEDEYESEVSVSLSRMGRPKNANGKSNGKASKKVAAVRAQESDDDDDDDEFIPEENNESADEDDELVLLSVHKTNDQNGFAIDVNDDDPVTVDDSDGNEAGGFVIDSDTPLSTAAEASNKRKRKKPTTGDNPDKPKRQRKKREPKKPKVKLTPFERRTNRFHEHHPDLVDTFPKLRTQAVREPCKAPHPEGMTIKLLPFQLEGLDWMIKQEEEGIYTGGILADEMGMGKTIQMISLMMHDREKTPNLVIAPTVAIMQWKTEIENHAGGALKVGMFHGANRAKTMKELEEFDVIMTTYAVVESCFRKERYGFKRKGRLVKEKSLLHNKHFYRVILDEAHNIKDRQSSTAKACNVLQCEKRWCLTGTPLQNRIGEFYSLIRFLKVEPFCKYFCTSCSCESMEWLFSFSNKCSQCGHPEELKLRELMI
ncbi:unnamed protein product [Ambrosiozyma monospora]|uniref:Unnamed protein product n=1 Tax=Ambrosiozyma monospora TaxID=43982 RepID=A0ACB5TQN5_AMBMO|nr:unnamed protein product [Ambrosiozyma monospora]